MSDWFKAEFHAEQAHQFYEAGQWEKAVDELKIALAVNPHQAEWHLGMGLALEALDRHEEAASSYARVLELRGDDVETLQLLAVAQLRTDEPAAAISTLERATAIDPNFEPAYCHRILAHAQLDEHDKAEEMFYLARQIVEHCPSCYDHIGHSLASRGLFDKAIWCWQQALKHDSQYPGAYANMARAYWHKNQPQRAYTMYVQQLRQEPGDIETLLDMGNLLMDLQRHAEAGEKFRRVLELDPTVATAHLHLGELALMAGHHDAAQASLEMAGRIDPELGGVHLCLAQVALARKQPRIARTELDAELQRSERSPHHNLDLARLLIEIGNPGPVVDLLTPLIDQAGAELVDDKRIASALLYRGVAQLITGKLEAGIADCRASVRCDKNQTLAMYNLSLAYQQQGRLTRSRYWLERACSLKPRDLQLRRLRWRLFKQTIHARIDRLRRKLGRRRNQG